MILKYFYYYNAGTEVRGAYLSLLPGGLFMLSRPPSRFSPVSRAAPVFLHLPRLSLPIFLLSVLTLAQLAYRHLNRQHIVYNQYNN